MTLDEAIWLLGLIFFLGICVGKLARRMQPIGSAIAAVLFVASLVSYWVGDIYYSRIVGLIALGAYGVTRYQHAKWQREQDAQTPG